MSIKTRATIEDLYKVEGKAELVNGEIVHLPPTGDDPGYAGDEIFVSLREYSKRTKTGRAFADNRGFHVHLPHREAFSPGVVWDVYLLSDDVIKVYRASDPDHPTVYRRGDRAEAEPAVPGWQMPIDDLFGYQEEDR